MALQYSYIDLDHNLSLIPPRSVNGGLYTGVAATGPWGNVPITPESHVMIDTHYTNGFIAPPPDMKYQAVSTTRPGNNRVLFPYHKPCTNLNFNRLCANT